MAEILHEYLISLKSSSTGGGGASTGRLTGFIRIATKSRKVSRLTIPPADSRPEWRQINGLCGSITCDSRPMCYVKRSEREREREGKKAKEAYALHWCCL